MEFTYSLIKQYYRLKQKIEQLTERERLLVVFVIILFLYLFWHFVIYNQQLALRDATEKKTQEVHARIKTIQQKKSILGSLISSPSEISSMEHYKQLTIDLKNLDQKFTHYNEQFINTKDLSRLLHNMLDSTFDVTVEDFSTFSPVIQPQVTSNSNQTAPNTVPTSERIHYRLIMRGTYFSVMEYLKKLEGLPWELYWDKFDYTVSKYPEGIVTIEFYTLKHKNIQPVVVIPDGVTQ